MRCLREIVALAGVLLVAGCVQPTRTEPAPPPAVVASEPEPEPKPEPPRVDPAQVVTLEGLARSQSTQGPPTPYVAFELSNPTEHRVELKLSEVHVAADGDVSRPATPKWSFEIGPVGDALQPESPMTISAGDSAAVPPGTTRRIIVHYANPRGLPKSAFPYSVRAVFLVDAAPMDAVATIHQVIRHPVR